MRLVAVAELADVGARREPPTSRTLHGGVKTQGQRKRVALQQRLVRQLRGLRLGVLPWAVEGGYLHGAEPHAPACPDVEGLRHRQGPP